MIYFHVYDLGNMVGDVICTVDRGKVGEIINDFIE